MKPNRLTDLLPKENHTGLPENIFCQLEADYHHNEEISSLKELWTIEIDSIVDLVDEHS